MKKIELEFSLLFLIKKLLGLIVRRIKQKKIIIAPRYTISITDPT